MSKTPMTLEEFDDPRIRTIRRLGSELFDVLVRATPLERPALDAAVLAQYVTPTDDPTDELWLTACELSREAIRRSLDQHLPPYDELCALHRELCLLIDDRRLLAVGAARAEEVAHA